MNGDFQQWINGLDLAAVDLGIGDGLTATTGEDIWVDDYMSGHSPREALLRDMALDGDFDA